MKSELFWVSDSWPGRLAIMPRPRGGDWLEDEVASWRRAGIEVILSLLTDNEVDELDLGREEEFCRAHDIRFQSLPIVDRGLPVSQKAFAGQVARLTELVRAGKNVAVHCRQGIGRAALMASCILVKLGMDPDAAIQSVTSARGMPVPETAEQKRWIVEFAV